MDPYGSGPVGLQSPIWCEPSGTDERDDEEGQSAEGLDDEDSGCNSPAVDENDGKTIVDEGYSYIRELEYQDSLLEEDEEDEEEAQPAKKLVKLGDEDADEESDEEDQSAMKLEEKDADEEDDMEVQPAEIARLDDVRRHLIQVRKAATDREARRYEEASTQIEDEDADEAGDDEGIMQPPVDKTDQMCSDAGPALKEVESYAKQLALYSDAGLAVKRNRKIQIHGIGIHPENRSGTSVDHAKTQKLARKIQINGYSETNPLNPMVLGYQHATNERNFAEGTGSIVPSCFRDIEYLPVTCSHTSAILNTIERGGL